MSTNSVLDAAYLTAHNQPGGIPALAARMQVNSTVLSHKLNPNNITHHLTVRDLVTIMHMTGSAAPLHALCMEFGHMALPIPAIADDETTSDALMHTCKEFSDFLQRTTEAMADKKVTKLELRNIRKELGEMVAAAGKLEAIAASMETKRGRQ